MLNLFSFRLFSKVLFVILLINSSSLAQDTLLHRATDWEPFFENASLRIDYKYANCDIDSQGIHREQVYLQFANKTDESVVINWDMELHYGDKCFNCESDNPEMKCSIDLAPNQVISGSCKEVNTPYLVLFSRHLDFESPMVLTQFKLNNLERISQKH